MRLRKPAPVAALAALAFALGVPAIASGQAFNVHYDGLFHNVADSTSGPSRPVR